jgi:tRNA threonylcarbamoyladenosine biosynthesis protein TsaB
VRLYHRRVNILAIDSATEACSVALLREDGKVFGEFEIAPRGHNRLLPEMMRRVLAQAALKKSMLSHCAFSNGPGAFTGIRIAAAQAQGIGVGLNIPLIPVSTLAVLAQTSFDRYPHNSVLVALDARMQEIYWALYRRDQQGCACLSGSERLTAADAVVYDNAVESGAGHGWLAGLHPVTTMPVDETLLPDARSLLRLASQAVSQQLMVAAGDITINYLRNRVAEKARK